MKPVLKKLSLIGAALLFAASAFGAGSEFYDHTTYPSQGSAGSSSAMRAELDLIEAGFDKLPTLAGNGGKITAINSGGTAIEAITTTGTGSGVRATSPTLTTPNLGTPSALVGTNITGLPLTTGITGTLPVANGGTGVTSSTGTGSVVLSSSPNLVTPALGTPASGVATNLTGLPLTTGVTGTLPVANGGTGIATATAYSPVFTGTTATGAFQATLGAGTSGQVLTSSGAGVLPVWGTGVTAATDTAAGIVELATTAEALTGTDTVRAVTPAGLATTRRVAQIVSTVTGAVATGTTQIPADDTIPQQTEGDQYMTLAITPTNASSTLQVTVDFSGSTTILNYVTVALFRDATASAVAAKAMAPGAATLGSMVFTVEIAAGSTSATTFKVRAGQSSASGTQTVTFNGASGARLFGGVIPSSITIKEILP